MIIENIHLFAPTIFYLLRTTSSIFLISDENTIHFTRTKCMHEAYACWCYWSFGKKRKSKNRLFFLWPNFCYSSSVAPFAFYGRYHFHWLVSRLSPVNFFCLAKSSNRRLVLVGFRRHCTADVRTILCPIHFLFPSQLVLSISLVIDVFLTAEARRR